MIVQVMIWGCQRPAATLDTLRGTTRLSCCQVTSRKGSDEHYTATKTCRLCASAQAHLTLVLWQLRVEVPEPQRRVS